MGVPSLADPFSRLVYSRGTAWTELLQRHDAEHGCLDTRSLNSLVTDSAAAASAWGCGQKVNNGCLNVLPSGKALTPITVLCKDRNLRTGIVTTDRITGATPSGFAVQQKSRNDFFDIAPQFMERVDVLMGGGRQHFEPGNRPDHRDLLVEYRSKGYRQCDDRHTLNSLSSCDRVIGLFADDTLPYQIDELSAVVPRTAAPNLQEMTRSALQHLADKDCGFFLMSEGGRVDHAAHANDAAAILHEQIDFENALGEALLFASNRDDTLVVVTSDHGNANPGLNGWGADYTKTDESFARLAKIRASFDVLRDQVRKSRPDQEPADAVLETLATVCDLSLDRGTATIVGDALLRDKIPQELAILQRTWVGVLSQVLGNHTGISFTGTNHTADRVLISAIGPGASRFSGIHSHTDIYHTFVEFFNAA